MARTKRRADSNNCLDNISKLETIGEQNNNLSENEEQNSDTKIEPKSDLKSEPKSDDIIYFIEVKSFGTVVRQPGSMQLAFASMRCHKFLPNWIKEEEVFEKEWSDSDKYLFIVDSFDDKIFDYLISKKLRVIGPLTVLYCYSSECPKRWKTIPEKTYPVFSQCMRKLVVSMSGFEGHKKQDMITKITRMCGYYSKDFTKKVTHLVTDSVRSKKYRVAKENNITVVSSLWVDFCWNECQHKLLVANREDIVHKCRLQMFYNLLITVSQVEVAERAVIKRLVEENGGEYSPSLKLAFNNTVLLLRSAEGQKFKYAYMRSIPCLNIQWLYDSIEKGYALPEEQYSIRSLSQRSENTQQMLTQNETKPTIDCQIINTKTTTNSSEIQDMGVDNNVDTIETTDNNCLSKDISQRIVETITQSNANRSDESFLEGCDVYIVGFDPKVSECIRLALIARGSMVYTEFKSIVTHVIVGPNCENSELMQFFDKSCKVVSFEWVMECIGKNECCDSTPFEIKKPNTPENSEPIGSQKRKRGSDIFDGPLTVVCPKRAKKAAEKWENNSKNDSKHNHKSLGDRLNQKTDIQWGNDEEEDIPSQRPYKEDSD